MTRESASAERASSGERFQSMMMEGMQKLGSLVGALAERLEEKESERSHQRWLAAHWSTVGLGRLRAAGFARTKQQVWDGSSNFESQFRAAGLARTKQKGWDGSISFESSFRAAGFGRAKPRV